MKRESRLYILFIIVPAIVGTMGWSWLVRSAWQKMWNDEGSDLDAQAELIAEVISSRLGPSNRHIGERPSRGDRGSPRRSSSRSSRSDIGPYAEEMGLDDGGDGPFGELGGGPLGDEPLMDGGPNGDGPRGNGPRGISDAKLVEACDSFASTNKDSTALAFKVLGMRGRVRYVAKNFPDKTGVTGSCRVRPPIGEGTLIVARADGGAGMRTRADDFIPKPLRIKEFLARIAVLFKWTNRMGAGKSAQSPSEILTIGAAKVDTKRFLISVEGEPDQPLTIRELGLLREFAEHPGEVLSRADLLEAVWGLEYSGTTRTLDQHVVQVRRKLGPSGDLIETIRGAGYRLRT